MPCATLNRPRIEEFQAQINLTTIQQSVMALRKELEVQTQAIVQTRRRLPRGWYRKSNPTFDLEVTELSTSESTKSHTPLQILKIWP